MKPILLLAFGLLISCAAAAVSASLVDSAAAAMTLPLHRTQG